MNRVQLGIRLYSLLRLSLAMSPLSSLQPLAWALHFSPPSSQRPAGWGWMQDLSPEMRVEQGLGQDVLGPSGSGYILTTLTLATSQSVNCPLAKGVQMWKLSLVSRQTLQRLLSEKLMTWGGCELAECLDGLRRWSCWKLTESSWEVSTSVHSNVSSR